MSGPVVLFISMVKTRYNLWPQIHSQHLTIGQMYYEF